MTISALELLPTIESLPSVEKFRLLQFLVAALGKETGLLPLDASVTYPVWTPYFVPAETVTKMEQMLAAPLLTAGTQYPVWTPLNAFGAAETLMQLLETQRATTP